MKHRIATRLALTTLITYFFVCGPLSTFAKPHETLTFEPIRFKPPIPEKHTLSNGMTLYLLEDHELPLFNINGLIKTGTIYDPTTKIGLSAIFANVMRDGGTVSREPEMLNEALESMAATVEIGMSREYGTINLSTLAEDIEQGLEIFADILRNPAFPQDKLELHKQQAVEGIRRRNDNPIQLAWRNFSALLYGTEHPFGWYSEIDGIESITLDDLKMFHSTYYHPNNIMLAISGDFDTKTLITQLEKVFEGWKAAQITFPDIPTVTKTPEPSVNYIFKDLSQTTMLIGHFGIKRHPDFADYFPLRVMNEILGEGGFTSRLMREVREKHGLAYMVGSLMQTTYYTNPGEWFAYSQTRADKTAEAISLIIDIVKDLRENPVPEAELKRTKDSLINSYVFRFESSTQIAFQQMMLAYRGYASDFLETYSDNIANVTAADVQAVAQKYLRPDALTIVAVGNQANFDRPLDEFGIVNEIGIEQPDPPPAEPIPEIGNTDVAKAQKILAAAVQAHGGLEKLRTVKNIVSEGYVIYQAEQQQIIEEIMEAKFYLMYPNKFRQDFKGSLDGEVSYIFDGTSAVVVTSAGKQPLLLEQATVMKDTIPGGGAWLLMHLVQAGGPLHYAGTEEVSGKPASVIHAKQPSGETLKIFIDEATHYMVKIGFRQVEEGVEIETTFEDYRDVAGIKIPYRVIIVFQFQDVEGEYDNRIGKIRVSSVTLNADLDESLFQKPE